MTRILCALLLCLVAGASQAQEANPGTAPLSFGLSRDEVIGKRVLMRQVVEQNGRHYVVQIELTPTSGTVLDTLASGGTATGNETFTGRRVQMVFQPLVPNARPLQTGAADDTPDLLRTNLLEILPDE